MRLPFQQVGKSKVQFILAPGIPPLLVASLCPTSRSRASQRVDLLAGSVQGQLGILYLHVVVAHGISPPPIDRGLRRGLHRLERPLGAGEIAARELHRTKVRRAGREVYRIVAGNLEAVLGGGLRPSFRRPRTRRVAD